MKKIVLTLLTLWFSISASFAQYQRCGTMEHHEEMMSSDAEYAENHRQIENMIQQRMNIDKSWKTTGIVTIPVVFHVLYNQNNATQNISTARINAQMAVLNQDYSGTNTDVGNVPSVFQPFVANTDIQFCLAVRDPGGNTTDGIIRKQTTVTSFGSSGNPIKFNSSGGDDAWPRDSYLNIWVGQLGGGLLGYAQFPGGAAATDGVVLLNGSVGGPGAMGTAAPYNRGRTATHEIGHWLNLRHINGDASCGNDFVADTPTQQSLNFGCPGFPKISCGNGPNGEMFMNYMDYVDDNCMIMFTEGQSTRMNTAITVSRASLITSLGCVPVTAGAPVANFQASATNIAVGTSINFTDLSTGNPTSWSWSFPGANPSSSTQQNPTNINYPNAGTYNVSLTATNGNGNNTHTKNGYIVVTSGGSGGCDTISNIPASWTPTLTMSSNGGYVSGHNGYMDIAKAEIFSQAIPANYEAVGLLIDFGVAKNANTTNTFNMQFWSGTGGTPGTSLVTTTKTYAAAAADVTGGNLTYAAVSPTTLTSPYFAGVSFTYAAGDTLAIKHTATGEVSVCTAWEQWSDQSWVAFNGPGGWGIVAAMAIYPILCDPTGVNEPVKDGIVIYPNPTSGQLIIHNSNNTSLPAVFKINNTIGQTVMQQELSSFSGTHYMDLSGLDNGLYLVEILTGNTQMVYRIMLNK